MFVKGLICLTLVGVCLTSLPHAQERAAVGATETQMTWSALKSAVDTVHAESQGAHTRIDQIVACNKAGKIYVASGTGDGCVANTDLANVITCGDKKQVYDKSAKACVNAEVTAPTLPKRQLWLYGGWQEDRPKSSCNFGANCSTDGARCYAGEQKCSRMGGSGGSGGGGGGDHCLDYVYLTGICKNVN